MLPLLVGSYEICIKKKLCWRKKMYKVPPTIVLLLMLYHTITKYMLMDLNNHAFLVVVVQYRCAGTRCGFEQ